MAAPLPDKPALPGAASSLSVPDATAPADRQNGEGHGKRALQTEETDTWWGSYAGRTMLPGFLLCLLLTVVLLILDWYLETRQRRSDLISSAVLGLAGAVWLFQGTRWVYRMIAVNYRLTNRRLLYTSGFKLPETWAIDLARITRVSVVTGSLERLLGVGRIHIQVDNADSPCFILEGVLAPERVARTIRRRVRQARAKGR
jgi:membrane protein YdbS with pleckstrin-like domain